MLALPEKGWITPQAETTDHQHVQEARDRFAAFINSHQAGHSSMVKIKVLFLGVGMKRNGEGLATVLRPYATRYTAVSFFNRERMRDHQQRRCRKYLGLEKNHDGAGEVEFRTQIIGHDFKTYLNKIATWPLPSLPPPQKCHELRHQRLRRCIKVTNVRETPGSIVLQALSLIELETSSSKRRARKRPKRFYKQ